MILTGQPRMAAWLESVWLGRYLDRLLTGEETAWFEAYLLDKPELLAAVDADTRLREALAAEPAAWRSVPQAGRARDDERVADIASGAATADSSTPDPSSRRRTRSRAAGSISAALALAASLVLGAGLGWAGRRSFDASRDAAGVIGNPTHVIYGGQVDVPRIERADSGSDYVLVDVAVPAGARSATVETGGADAGAVPLRAAGDGFVSFLIQRALIRQHLSATLRYVDGAGPHARTLPIATDLDRSGA